MVNLPLPLLLRTQNLFLTGIVVQLPAWIAAVLGQAILTHTLAGGLVHDLVRSAECQKTRVLNFCKRHRK